MGKHRNGDHAQSQFMNCPLCGGSGQRDRKTCNGCHGKRIIRAR